MENNRENKEGEKRRKKLLETRGKRIVQAAIVAILGYGVNTYQNTNRKNKRVKIFLRKGTVYKHTKEF